MRTHSGCASDPTPELYARRD